MYQFGQRLKNKIVKGVLENQPSKKLQPGRLVIVDSGPFKGCTGILNSITGDGMAIVEGVNTELICNAETNYLQKKKSCPIPLYLLKHYSIEHNSPIKKIIKVFHPYTGKIALIDERSINMPISKVSNLLRSSFLYGDQQHKVPTRREILNLEKKDLLEKNVVFSSSTTSAKEASKSSFKASLNDEPIPKLCIL